MITFNDSITMLFFLHENCYFPFLLAPTSTPLCLKQSLGSNKSRRKNKHTESMLIVESRRNTLCILCICCQLNFLYVALSLCFIQFNAYMDQLPNYEKLMKEPSSFWISLIDEYFVKAFRKTVCVTLT